MNLAWLNGEYVTGESISISAFNHPYLRGDGVFESTRTEGHQIFFLQRHLERLEHSAKTLMIEIPDLQVLAACAQDVVSTSNNLDVGSLRITLFSNGDQLITHQSISPDSNNTRLVVYPEAQYSGSHIATAKSLSYARSAAALRWAAANHGDEVIFVDENGFALETALANFVAEIDGQFMTPPLEKGALRGITRTLAVEWFSELIERPISRDDLERADGILLLSGVRFIRPAQLLNGRPLKYSQEAAGITAEFLNRARAYPNS